MGKEPLEVLKGGPFRGSSKNQKKVGSQGREGFHRTGFSTECEGKLGTGGRVSEEYDDHLSLLGRKLEPVSHLP